MRHTHMFSVVSLCVILDWECLPLASTCYTMFYKPTALLTSCSARIWGNHATPQPWLELSCCHTQLCTPGHTSSSTTQPPSIQSEDLLTLIGNQYYAYSQHLLPPVWISMIGYMGAIRSPLWLLPTCSVTLRLQELLVTPSTINICIVYLTVLTYIMGGRGGGGAFLLDKSK